MKASARAARKPGLDRLLFAARANAPLCPKCQRTSAATLNECDCCEEVSIIYACAFCEIVSMEPVDLKQLTLH